MGKACALRLAALSALISSSAALDPNAFADTIPDARAAVLVPSERLAGSPGLTASGSGFGGDFYTAEALGQPSPVLAATANSGPDFPPVVEQSASADEDYWFEIEGPANTIVPVVVAGSISASLTGGGEASATVSMGPDIEPPDGTGPSTLIASLCVFSVACFDTPTAGNIAPDGTFRTTIDFMSNTVIGVEQDVDAVIMAQSIASASVDESIEVDPTFLLADEFSIVASQGVDVAPAGSSVPSPGSLSLFVGGLIALSVVGLVRRRRRPVVD